VQHNAHLGVRQHQQKLRDLIFSCVAALKIGNRCLLPVGKCNSSYNTKMPEKMQSNDVLINVFARLRSYLMTFLVTIW